MNSAIPLSPSETFPLPRTEPIAIHRVLDLFEKGSPELFGELSEQLDFRIDHYRDETDVAWQVASGLEEMAGVLQRLAQDVFPKGNTYSRSRFPGIGAGMVPDPFRAKVLLSCQELRMRKHHLYPQPRRQRKARFLSGNRDDN